MVCVGYLFFKPNILEPESYQPQPESNSNLLKENSKLKQAELISLGNIKGPESIAVDEKNYIYTGDSEGNILKISPEGEILFSIPTGGRPLGVELDKKGELYICDAYKGLLKLNLNQELEILSTESDGIPFRFTDDLAISSEGIVYFTDASFKYEQKDYLYDLLEAKPNGRLLAYDTKSKTTKSILKNLYFANGVALSQKEDFLLVNETYRYRIKKYYIKGDKKGTEEIFMDTLFGFPDNITSDGKGNFYLALFTIRNPIMDLLHQYPSLKKAMANLPKLFWPKPKPFGLVLKLDENHTILETYQEPTGIHLKEITSAFFKNGFLYLGSLHNDRMGKLKLD